MDKQDDNSTVDTKDNDSAQTGQVMDIQPPRSINVTGDGDIQDSQEDAGESIPDDSVAGTPALPVEPTPSSVDSSSDSEISETLSEEPESSAQPSSTPDLNAAASSAQAGDATPAMEGDKPVSSPSGQGDSHENPLAIPPQPAHHAAGAPVIAIVIAIVVALGLASAVIFAYTKNNDNAKPNTATNTTTQTAEKPQASASDVDATDKEIDQSLSKTNEATDFPATELSDTAIGL